MRITNTMITDNAMVYIGANKGSVDANNTRMTTQKKIDRPSEDPVVAVRSLRLQTSLDKINQFYEKNIPDATSWMDVTETALLNIEDIMLDVRTLCVQGATDTLTESDRKTIYEQLKALQEQLFKEGNADYAGRTVFTGFRTNKDLVFSKDEAKTSYSGIQQPFNAVDMELTRYYTNKVTIPTNRDEVLQLDKENLGVRGADFGNLPLVFLLFQNRKIPREEIFQYGLELRAYRTVTLGKMDIRGFESDGGGIASNGYLAFVSHVEKVQAIFDIEKVEANEVKEDKVVKADSKKNTRPAKKNTKTNNKPKTTKTSKK